MIRPRRPSKRCVTPHTCACSSILVALAAAAEGVLDYVFKLQASTMTDGPGLLRLFGVFYTVTSLLTILLQVTVLRWIFNQLGIARSTMLLARRSGPRIARWSRGTRLLLRGSRAWRRNGAPQFRSFRSAQELLYSPVSALERRAAKPVVDVGGARLGDIAGAGLAQLAILAAPVSPRPLLLVATLRSCSGHARRSHGGCSGDISGRSSGASGPGKTNWGRRRSPPRCSRPLARSI